VLNGGLGDDTLDGGEGIDTADYGYRTGGITVELQDSGDDFANIGGVIETLRSIESVTGGSGGDLLIGDSGANALDGGAGNDQLRGNGGDDVLTGGAGDDVFIFADGDGDDIVTDFQNGADRFDLSAVDDVDGFSDLAIVDNGFTVTVDYGTGSFELDNASNPALIDASDFHFA
jgi:Ca2+-binding RTX toxin-like protein